MTILPQDAKMRPERRRQKYIRCIWSFICNEIFWGL